MNRAVAGADDVATAAANRERTRSRVTLAATPERLRVAARQHADSPAADADEDMGGKKIIPRNERTHGAPVQASKSFFGIILALNC